MKTKEGWLPIKEKWTHDGVSNIKTFKGKSFETENLKTKRQMTLQFDITFPDEESTYFIAS